VVGAPVLSRALTVNMLDYHLQWGSINGASRYELHESKNSGSWSSVYSGASTSMLFTQPLLAQYDYRVRACDNSGCGSWSATLAAMTPKTTFTTNDPLGTPMMRSQQNRSTDNTTHSYPYGQQADKP
jgi:hypothetical protein